MMSSPFDVALALVMSVGIPTVAVSAFIYLVSRNVKPRRQRRAMLMNRD